MNKKWIRNKESKINTPSDLALGLTTLLPLPQKVEVFFSFQNENDKNITYIINAATFPKYNPIIFNNAINIKTWILTEEKSSNA